MESLADEWVFSEVPWFVGDVTSIVFCGVSAWIFFASSNRDWSFCLNWRKRRSRMKMCLRRRMP